jgi:hypothetical protein
MNSIVERLRDRAYSFKAPDPLMEEAANEIERLRGYRDMAEADRDVAMLAAERLRLTDEEREAVRFCVTASLPETEKLGGVAGELCRMHAATLGGLLERLG